MMAESPKVLLVEDNPDTVEFLARRLREEGYQVLVARNGVDAWRLANRERPDAIVMDINLPQLDGDEVARRLRAQPETVDIPIIFVTAETAARVQDLLVPGHTLCLEKAIKSRSLLDALTQVLA
jgi:CheY-like chemotaxis protein